MITTLILDLVNSILTGINAILPGVTMPSWLSSGTLIPSSVSTFVGALLHTISPIFPSAVLIEIFVGVCSLWPFVASYVVAQWVFRHLPTIAGFGISA